MWQYEILSLLFLILTMVHELSAVGMQNLTWVITGT